VHGWKWAIWLRRLPMTVALGIAAAVAGAAFGILTMLEAPLWTRLLATVLVAIIAAGVVLDKWGTERRAKQEKQQEKRQQQTAVDEEWVHAISECVLWEMPNIRDVDPHRDLDVTLSDLAKRHIPEGQHLPPYVARDIDESARTRLHRQGAVLLLGTPGSGVTHTAYEVATSAPTSPLTVIALTPGGLMKALGELEMVSRLKPGTHLLLWLDRIDTFTAAGLSAAVLRRFMERSPKLRVIATISSLRFEHWATENRSVADILGDPLVLERVPSADELERAEAAYPGVDFNEGIAAAFTNTATLLRRLKGGSSSCPHEPAGDDCALARVATAIVDEWVRTDSGRPISSDRLSALAQLRLGAGKPIEEAHLESALEWATSRVVGGASLLSFVTDEHGERMVTAHPAYVEVSRAEGASPSEDVWLAALEVADAADDSSAVGRIGFRAHCDDNAPIAAQAWARIGAANDSATEWLQRAADISRKCRTAARAVPPLQRLLELRESAHGRRSIEVATVLDKLGSAWAESGRPDIARELFEESLDITEIEHGPDHRAVVPVLRDLGGAWTALSQPAKAVKVLQRALDIRQSDVDSEDLEMASLLNNLGGAWSLLGEPTKAQEMFNQALAIAEREGGGDSFIALLWDSLANTYDEQGNPAEGSVLHERALEMIERVAGPHDVVVGKVLSNLGRSLLLLQQPTRARDALERAVRILQRASLDAPYLAMVLVNLGEAWQRTGEAAKAREVHELAAAIFEREYGPTHPNVGITFVSLANAHSTLREPAKARYFNERALAIFEREFGRDHPKVATVLVNLGNAHFDLGQSAEALEFHGRAQQILRRHYPYGHPLIDLSMANMRRAGSQVLALENGLVGPLGSVGPVNQENSRKL
jgi:tetratricopeptide (TPR) repeat protein